MPQRRDLDLLEETPIERIFQKVMGRKMTAFERICFHLKRRIKPPPRDGTAEAPSGQGPAHKNGPELISHTRRFSTRHSYQRCPRVNYAQHGSTNSDGSPL